MWPQLTYMALTMLSLGMGLQKAKTGIDAIGHFIPFVLIQSLLYFGGFYDCFLK